MRKVGSGRFPAVIGDIVYNIVHWVAIGRPPYEEHAPTFNIHYLPKTFNNYLDEEAIITLVDRQEKRGLINATAIIG